MIPESELPVKFMPQLKTLIKDCELREQLAENIKQKAKPNATQRIVDEIEKLLNK
jgi:UDP-N-acetylglucosamine--N-acetylmuramyl-(pentapeptide) pyrophosphoryl-undecaprenol N-acetylglucosamine transferase